MNAVPRTPSSLTVHARACLQAVADEGLGGAISLGGALGLAYYLDYRATADVDAWWSDSAGRTEKEGVLAVLVAALGPFGQTRVRSWGDVSSVDLLEGGKTVFSFQVAQRSARLREPVNPPWPAGVRLDHLDDLLAGKMEALVNRGAPRDFRDAHEVCDRGLSSPAALWALWADRRLAVGQDRDPRRAALAVRTHLERIERVRPLETIVDGAEREKARSVRGWVREELLHGLV